MAYDLIPKKAQDIMGSNSAKNKYKDKIDNIVSLFEALCKLDPEKQPIAIDPVSAKKEIAIRRSLMGIAAQEVLTSTTLQQAEFKKAFSKLGVDTTGLVFKFGDGSRGNKGSNNRGIGFEADIVADFIKWKQGEPILKKVNETFIRELVKEYKLTNASRIEVIPEGAMNKKRPLQVGAGTFYVGNSRVFNIGSTVTDVTVKSYKRTSVDKVVYLSLKRGETVAYFNAGLANVLNERDTKDFKFSATAKQFMSHLGLDPLLVQRTLTPRGRPPMKPIASIKDAKVNKRMIQELLRSAVGYGFHMVHLFDKRGGFIKHFNVTEAYARDAGAINTPVQIDYGGIRGYSRMIRISFGTKKYRKVELYIRNKQNARMFPTDFVSNFYY